MGSHKIAWLGCMIALSGCANNAARDLASTDPDSIFGQKPDAGTMAATTGGNGNGETTGAASATTGAGTEADGGAGTDGGASSNTTGSETNTTGGSEPDAGTVIPPAPTGVIISEVMARPDKGSGNEWLELFNAGTASVNLKGCTLATGADQNNDTAIDADLTIAPGAYVLLGRDQLAEESGVTPDYVYSGIYLSPDETVTVSCNGQIVTQVSYEGAEVAASLQLDARYVLAGETDVSSAWCDGSDALPASSNLGTPKAANRNCAGVPAP